MRKTLVLIYAIVWAVVAGQITSAQDTANEVYHKAQNSVFLIYVTDASGKASAQGTGFLVAPRKIATNAHVANAGNLVIVIGPARIPAKVQAIDAERDLAILGVDIDLAATPLSLNIQAPLIGEQVYALTNPEGLEKTFSQGIVSAIRTFRKGELLQLTTPISHGSSGGPILNAKGEVIGVAKGILEEGQNLNFAVPAAALNELLARPANISLSPAQALAKAKVLIQERSGIEYSADDNSPYHQQTRVIEGLLQQSVNTLDNKLILNSLSIVCDEDTDLCIDAERKSIRLQATPEARLFLARALELNAIFTQDEQQKHLILDEAVSMAQVAVKEQKIPNNFTLSVLAYLYELKDNHAEALKLYQRSLSAPSTQNSPNRAVLVRGVIRNASALKQNQVAMSMFPQLVSTGEASISDWEEEAYRRDEIKDFAGSATAFDQAAGLAPKDGIDWCRAVLELAVVRPYQTDEILRDGRECLKREALSRTEHIVDLDGVLSSVNSYMSTALLGRGVYKEAYNYAREATKLKPGSDTAFDALGDAAFYRPSQPRKKLLGFQMAGTPLCIFGSVQHTLRFNSGVRPSRNFETLPS